MKNRKIIVELLLVVFLKIILDISYVYFVNKVYEYDGFFLNLNYVKFIESYSLLILVFFTMSRTENRFSEVFTKMIFILMILPTLSLYAMKDESRLFLYIFVLSFLLTVLITKLPFLQIKKVAFSQKLMSMAVISTTGFTFLVLIKNNGLPDLTALNLLNVYAVREKVIYGSAIMDYLVNWQARIINMFILGIALYRKNYTLLALGLFLQITLFLLTGHKFFLFAPAVVLGINFFVKRNIFFVFSLLSIICVAIVSLILYANNISLLYASLFIRRVFFVPAQHYFYYYHFFSEHDFTYLSHSILSSIFSYPYDLPTPILIGKYFYGNPDTWANTGYLADAYMNFGFVGMILYSIILGLILLLIDSLNVNRLVTISTVIMGLYYIIDGALQTSLLSGGVLLGILLLYFYSVRGGRNN